MSMAQAENLHTPAQYEEALQYVLEKCVVDVATLDQTHQLILATIDDRKLSLKMSRMTVIQGRPRLRDRVASELKTEERKAQMDTKLETWDSYRGFCYLHQFPINLSEKIRSKLYFLCAQTTWPWASHIKTILPSGGTLCDRLASRPVVQPDLPVILRVIEGLSMDGSPPFEKMTLFRKECFTSFPVTFVQRLTLSQILQLYMAAYQNPAFWKQLWKDLVGVISVQIIRDIETFVATHPFAHEDAIRFIARS